MSSQNRLASIDGASNINDVNPMRSSGKLDILSRRKDANNVSTIDIVLVYGLGVDSSSPRAPSTPPRWVKDIPCQIDGARIMAFTYNRETIEDRASILSPESITQIAEALLSELLARGDGIMDRRPPIAFIAHDIGGAIVKKALVIAQKSTQYSSILEDCSHVTFFCAPHRAVDLCSWEEYVLTTAVASSLPLSTAFNIARRIGALPTFLKDLSYEFISLCSRWSIINIYQKADGTKPSSNCYATINTYLATTSLIHDVSIGYTSSHEEAFRFSESEPIYSTILNTLKAETDLDYRTCLSRLLDFSPAFTIPDNAPILSLIGHTAWPLENYDEWLEHPSRSIISTIDNSGSCERLTSSGLFRKLKNESRLAVYFSFVQAGSRGSSAASFLASAVFQLLSQVPERFPSIRDQFAVLDKLDAWTYPNLRSLFRVLLDTKTDRGPLHLIIDGLRRCTKNSQSVLNDLLIIPGDQRLSTPIKVALFSRGKDSIEEILEAHESLCLPEVILAESPVLSGMPIGSALATRVIKKWTYLENPMIVDQTGHTALYYAVCSNDEALVETIAKRLSSVDKFQDIEDVFLCAIELGHGRFIERCLTSTANNSRSRFCNVSRESDGYSALHIAAEKGYEDIVRLLLKFDAEVDALDHEGRTPLVLAAVAGEVGTVSLLLDHRANARLEMSDGHTTLTYVVCQAGDSRRHADVVKKLLDTGIDPNARSAHKLSALHWAAGKGNFEVTSALLQRGADARATGPDGSSTLHYLARHTVAKTNIAQALIEAGSDPMKPDEHGRLPLHIASEAGDIKLMEFMIERNPSSINTLGTDHRTTLHFGIKSTESIDWLLDRGLNIDAKDKKGKTALMLAVESGIVSSISALLKRDANVRITRKDGSTVLHVAVHHDNLDIGRELLKWHPTILSCRDRENASALHDAISWGKSKFALMLLDEHYAKIIEDSPGRIRADLHAEETIEEETPLMSAVRMRNQAVIRKLRELGASTEHVNKHGKNALLLAVRLGDQSVLDALLDNNVGNCPDVNAGGGTQPTALHEAARRGKKDMVESLISKHNARISEQGGRFNTALSAAAAKGWPEVVYYLIDNWGEAAGVNLPGGNFANSLGAALSSREFQLLPHLLRAKADVNAIDAQGRSSFHIAAALGSWDVILKLRKAEGAKPPKTDKQGRTLLHHAAVNRDAEVFQNLLRDEELASSINSRDVDGWMPIHWACKENNADVIRLICDQGNSAITETTTNGWTPENIAIICRADDAVDFIKNLRQKSGGQDKDDSNGGEVSEEALDPTGKQLQPGRHWVVGAQHGGITCDGCFMNPIIGVRWRCADCEHFNFCFKCFWTVKMTHNSEHEFRPDPVWGENRLDPESEEDPEQKSEEEDEENEGSEGSDDTWYCGI